MSAPMAQDSELMAEHDDSMNNTITQSSLAHHIPHPPPHQQHQQQQQQQQQQQYQQQQSYGNSQHYHNDYNQQAYSTTGTGAQDSLNTSTSSNRPATSSSDTTFARSGYQHHSEPDNGNGPYRSGSGFGSEQTLPGSKMPSRPPSAMSGSTLQQGQDQQPGQKNPSVVIKVGMVGDAQIGKTSLMVKYVEGSWDEDYIQTLGVNFMEKTISIRNTEITFSIWDLGGQREFVNMLPLVCNDAVAILFMFDLTRKSTLNSIKEWYRQGRGFNKTAIPFLVGTKYDTFVNFPREEQEEISNQARRFAKAMKASLIFSSTSHSINVQKIFKIVLSKAFDLRCTIPEIENVGEPLLLYQSV